MTTVALKGAPARNWFAEQLVKDHGADGARERTCGSMRKAVEQVIARCGTLLGQGAEAMAFTEWVDSLPDDERETLTPADAWAAAVAAERERCTALVAGNYGWRSDTKEYHDDLGDMLREA